ncbi:tyrosine-protein kinase [Psychromonas sp. MB-3u-54]|uniref:polysaccharide biosynthesis tyrosine autokinase n=1 Tax=Psychromonas sp. MB-3u-54 TaxID=2058319 RepID=UPI000C33687E|nr:polysaccharide biosynthesis tyrosine autokinase [Psychromonas sp. MB-3u-54]PKH03430.1 tyrosine-protein kinase [Psychromonas sp. MB-3u-54]
MINKDREDQSNNQNSSDISKLVAEISNLKSVLLADKAEKQSASVRKQNSNNSDDINLGKLVGVLLDGKWFVVLVTAMFMAVGIVYALSLTPIYQADALVQIEQKGGGPVSMISGMGEVFSQESSAATEIEIITSRMVLSKTVNALNLTRVAAPIYFPYFGKGFARIRGHEGVINISHYVLPKDAQEKMHSLTLLDNKLGTYQLSDAQDKIILSGKVGVLAEKDGYRLLVEQITGENNQKFNIGIRSDLNAINWLKGSLSIREKGDTGMLLFTFTGSDRIQIQNILDNITSNYYLQNLARNAAEAKSSLDFINTNLPEMKQKLTAFEDALNRYKQNNDSINLSFETSSMLEQMVGLEAQLNDLIFQESDMSQSFTKEHPTYIALLDKRKMLESQRDALNNKIQKLPKKQQAILRIMRDVEVNQAIYLQLLNKKQELSIIQASTVGNVRILDNARVSGGPIKPKKSLIVVMATLLGGMLSVAYILLKSAFHRGIESPDQIEALGLSVYASIPKSAGQVQIDKDINAKKKNKQRTKILDTLLCEVNGADLAVEALRSLRTSLYFVMMEAKNNIMMVCGPSPGIGKSFISGNLAGVIAKAGQKVLVIDADLRKGGMSRSLSQSNENGLSDYLVGNISIAQAIKNLTSQNMDFITRGKVPPNPSELLLHPRFKALLDWAAENYDIVIVDTPPVLAVTDAGIVGEHCGTTLLIGHFDITTTKEIEISVQRLAQAGVEVKGTILNAVEKTGSNRYSYGYYNYSYESDNT